MNKEINIIGKSEDLKYHFDQENVVINYYNDEEKGFTIDFILDSDCDLKINISTYVKSDIQIKINGDILGNNNKCVIKVRAIGQSHHADIIVNVKTQENTHNNYIVEDLKAITESGSINLMPILEIASLDVNASHFAVVGSYNQDELFYLMTKGISEHKAKKMLKNSFVINLFNEKMQNLIKGGE